MRIAISGTQNQGKTTLCNDILKTWPNYKKSAESYRSLIKEHNIPTNRKATKDGQGKILDCLCKDAVGYKRITDMVLFDRCAFDNIIYTMWSYDKNVSDIDAAFVQASIMKVREAMRNLDIIFFLPITKAAPVPIESRDGRDIDVEYINEIDHLFKAAAMQHQQHDCPFFIKGDAPAIIEIFGSPEERIELVKHYINNTGDLVESASSVLDINSLVDMESLVTDQKEQLALDNKSKLIERSITGIPRKSTKIG